MVRGTIGPRTQRHDLTVSDEPQVESTVLLPHKVDRELTVTERKAKTTYRVDCSCGWFRAGWNSRGEATVRGVTHAEHFPAGYSVTQTHKENTC